MNGTIDNNNIKSQPRGIVMPKSRPSNGIAKVIIAISVLVIIAFGVVIALNVGGIRDKFSMKKMAEETVENDKQQQLNALIVQLEAEKTSLSAIKSELVIKENDLSERELLLEQSKKEVEELKTQLEVKATDIQSLTKLYEKMEPANAANIMMKYSDKSIIVNIIKNMSQTKAAEILSEMDASSAAQLLGQLSQ